MAVVDFFSAFFKVGRIPGVSVTIILNSKQFKQLLIYATDAERHQANQQAREEKRESGSKKRLHGVGAPHIRDETRPGFIQNSQVIVTQRGREPCEVSKIRSGSKFKLTERRKAGKPRPCFSCEVRHNLRFLC